MAYFWIFKILNIIVFLKLNILNIFKKYVLKKFQEDFKKRWSKGACATPNIVVGPTNA
jgi:hypothetical protein